MVAILMSTYNGEAYLKQQIDSILCQSYRDFLLFIRDDGSKDGTAALVRSYNDDRIRFQVGENLGPAGSFFALLRQALEFDYIFFSDQDDIWIPDKLEKMLQIIKPYGDVPTMVFSDFTMIDSDGNETAASYAQYANLQVAPGNVPLMKVLAQPYVFGCASVINRALAVLVTDPPKQIEMHDCWICQSAAAVGNLVYYPLQTIAHRFHSANATGRSGQDSSVSRLKRLTVGLAAQSENSALRLRQVNLLLDRYDGRIIEPVRSELAALSAAFKKGRIATIQALRKYGVTRQKTINTLFFYLTVLGIKGDLQ